MRSKLLVMDTGCTMVKYMPILERDVPTSANKTQIAALFDSDALQTPTEIRSEISGQHCLETYALLAKHGQFDG